MPSCKSKNFYNIINNNETKAKDFKENKGIKEFLEDNLKKV